MNIINYIISILLLILSTGVLYLYFLILFSWRKRPCNTGGTNQYNFLILIPAHNEEKVIENTLNNLKDLETSGKTHIVVIADNCTDNTTDLARKYDVTVLERNNSDEIGKGYAIRYAIGECGLEKYDAVAIIDSDTIPDKKMLKTMGDSFDNGAGAVQVYNGFLTQKKSSLTYLQQMANAVENIFFYKARANLGLPILLRGTGMGIRTDILKKYPWEAFSITEDVEYSTRLLMDGIKIDFNADSAVFSPATSTYKQSESQKSRWSSGTFELIRNWMFPLIKKGITKRKFGLIELGLSFLLMSRPLFIYVTILIMALSLLGGGQGMTINLIWGAVTICLIIVYLCSGVFLIPDKKAGFKALIQIPFFGFWYFMVQLKSLLNLGKLKWERTERE